MSEAKVQNNYEYTKKYVLIFSQLGARHIDNYPLFFT